MAQINLDLKFIPDSVDDYISAFVDLMRRGVRTFVVRGNSPEALAFLEQAKILSKGHHVDFRTPTTSPELLSTVAVCALNDLTDNSAILLFMPNARALSAALMDYIFVKNCTIVAPITEHYAHNRPFFINSVPKSGTHLLFECARSFGLADPPSLDLPQLHDDLLPGTFYNLQHMTPDFLAIPYPKAPNFIHQLCNSVMVFIWRDPRDVAVSMAHYLVSQWEYHILQSYMSRLSRDDRLTAVINGDYPIPIYINRQLSFSGDIRELFLRYADWIRYPLSNVIFTKFEDLIGPQGGGEAKTQISEIWKLQLALHVSGNPADYALRIFSERSLTFRKGQIGSYRTEFSPLHHRLFAALPQDFMQILGYSRGDGSQPEASPSRGGELSVCSADRPIGASERATQIVGVGTKTSGTPHVVTNSAGSAEQIRAEDTQLGKEVPRKVEGSDAGSFKIVGSNRDSQVANAKQHRYPTFGFEGLISIDEKPVPCIVKQDFEGFNIFLYGGKFYAVSKVVENFDFRENVEELNRSTKCFVGDSLRDAEAWVRATEKQNPAALPTITKSDGTQSREPQIMDEYRGFNIIQGNGSVYGLRQSIGPVDISLGNETLSNTHSSEDVIIATSADTIKARIDIVELSRVVDLIKSSMTDRPPSWFDQFAHQVASIAEELNQRLEDTSSRLGVMEHQAAESRKLALQACSDEERAQADIAAIRVSAVDQPPGWFHDWSQEVAKIAEELHQQIQQLAEAMDRITARVDDLSYGPGDPSSPLVIEHYRGFRLVLENGKIRSIPEGTDPTTAMFQTNSPEPELARARIDAYLADQAVLSLKARLAASGLRATLAKWFSKNVPERDH